MIADPENEDEQHTLLDINTNEPSKSDKHYRWINLMYIIISFIVIISLLYWMDVPAHLIVWQDSIIISSHRYPHQQPVISIEQLINNSINTFIDPLPSCSILNENLTRNILHHQWMIQHKHIHSDCSSYSVTGQCVYISSNINSSLVDRPHLNSHISFVPKWLVFHISAGPGKAGGSGGLADRLKGLLTVFGTSLLIGRSFALFVEDYVPFGATFDRGIVEWIDYESIPVAVRDGGKVHTANWQSIDINRPMHIEWSDHDIVIIKYNMNGWPDFVDRPNLLSASRAFGFHTATEKGDMDLYWECMMDALFTYTPNVLDVLNPLLQSMNRPPLMTWKQRSKTVPTLSQIIERQAVEQRVKSHSLHLYDQLIELSHQQSVQLYRSKFSLNIIPANTQSNVQANNTASVRPRSLYCLQIRMGSNGQQLTNNQTIGFNDTEGFVDAVKLQTIFGEFDAKITNHSGVNRALATLFITSDSDLYVNLMPQSISSSDLLVVPGRTAHIDKMADLVNAPRVMLEASIKAIVTHYMLGECDMAIVTDTGFGPTGLWRGRNRAHAEHPLQDQVWEDKYKLRSDGQITPYVHMRGSVGREKPGEYRQISSASRAKIEQQILVNETLINALRPELYGSFQASSRLNYSIPDDPACVRMYLYDM